MKYLAVDLNESIFLKEEGIEKPELINNEYHDFFSFQALVVKILFRRYYILLLELKKLNKRL